MGDLSLPKISLNFDTDIYRAQLTAMGSKFEDLPFLDFEPGDIRASTTKSLTSKLSVEPKQIFDINGELERIWKASLTPQTWSNEKLKQLDPTVSNLMFASSQKGVPLSVEQAQRFITGASEHGLAGPAIFDMVFDYTTNTINDLSSFLAMSEVTGGGITPSGDTMAVPTSITTQESELAPLINEIATRNSLDPAMLMAIVMAESTGNPTAWNQAGEDSRGLLQLNFAGGQGTTAIEQGLITSADQSFDPVTNLMIGTPPIAQAYQAGLAQGLTGDALVAYVAQKSGHPGDVSASDYRIQNIIRYYNQFKTKGYTTPVTISNTEATLTGKMMPGADFTAEALRANLQAAGITPEVLQEFEQMNLMQADVTDATELLMNADTMMRENLELPVEIAEQIIPAVDTISEYLMSIRDVDQGYKDEIDAALLDLKATREFWLNPMEPSKNPVTGFMEDMGSRVGSLFASSPTHVITDPIGKGLELVHKSPWTGLAGTGLLFIPVPGARLLGAGLIATRGLNTLNDWEHFFRSGAGIGTFMWHLTKPEALMGYNEEQQALLVKERIEGAKDLEGRATLGIPEDVPIIAHSVETNPIEWMKRAGDILTANPLAQESPWQDLHSDWHFSSEHGNMVMGQVHPSVRGLAHLVSEGVEATVKSAAYLFTNPAELGAKAKVWPLYWAAKGVGYEPPTGIEVLKEWDDINGAFERGAAQPTSDELANYSEILAMAIGFPMLGKAGRGARSGLSFALRGSARSPVISPIIGNMKASKWGARILELFEPTFKARMTTTAAQLESAAVRHGILGPDGIARIADLDVAKLAKNDPVKVVKAMLSMDAKEIGPEQLATIRHKLSGGLRSASRAYVENLQKTDPGKLERELDIVREAVANMARGRANIADKDGLLLMSELGFLPEGPLGVFGRTLLKSSYQREVVPYLQFLGGAGRATLKSAVDATSGHKTLTRAAVHRWIQTGLETMVTDGPTMSPFAIALKTGKLGTKAPDEYFLQKMYGFSSEFEKAFPAAAQFLGWGYRYIWGPMISSVLLTPAFAYHVGEESLARTLFYTKGVTSYIPGWPGKWANRKGIPIHVVGGGHGQMFGGILGYQAPGGATTLVDVASPLQKSMKAAEKSFGTKIWTPFGKTIDGFFRAVKGVELKGRMIVWEDAYKKETQRLLKAAGFKGGRKELNQRLAPYVKGFEETLRREGVDEPRIRAFVAELEADPAMILQPNQLEMALKDLYLPTKHQIKGVDGKVETVDLGFDTIINTILAPSAEFPAGAYLLPPSTRYWVAEQAVKGPMTAEKFAAILKEVPERARLEISAYMHGTSGQVFAESMVLPFSQLSKGNLAAVLERLGKVLRDFELKLAEDHRLIWKQAVKGAEPMSPAAQNARRLFMDEVQISFGEKFKTFARQIDELASAAGMDDLAKGTRKWLDLWWDRLKYQRDTAQKGWKVYDDVFKKSKNAAAAHNAKFDLEEEALTKLQSMDQAIDHAHAAIFGLLTPEEASKFKKIVGQGKLLEDAKKQVDDVVNEHIEKVWRESMSQWKVYEPKVKEVFDAFLGPDKGKYAEAMFRATEDITAEAGALAGSEWINASTGEISAGLRGPTVEWATEPLGVAADMGVVRASKTASGKWRRPPTGWKRITKGTVKYDVREGLSVPEALEAIDSYEAARKLPSFAPSALGEPVGPEGTVRLRDWLYDIESNAREFANNETLAMFVDYRATEIDQIMRKIFPFWMYETRAPATWFGKILPENPWLGIVWKKYLDFANRTALPGQPQRMYGLVPIPTNIMWETLGAENMFFDPLRGSYINRINRQYRDATYPQFGEQGFGWGKFLNLLHETAGIYIAPFTAQAIYAMQDMPFVPEELKTGVGWSSESLPGLLGGATWLAQFIAGQAGLKLGDAAYSGPYNDYQYNLAVANQAAAYRYEQQAMVDRGEITKEQADFALEHFEPNEMLIQTQNSALKLFFWAFPREKGMADEELRKNIEFQENVAKLGIPISTQEALRAAGKSVYSLLTREEERLLRTQMPELEYYSKTGWPFKAREDPEMVGILIKRDTYYTMTEAKRASALQAQKQDDAMLQRFTDEVEQAGMPYSPADQILDVNQWKERYYTRWYGSGNIDSPGLDEDPSAGDVSGVQAYIKDLKASLGDIFKEGKEQVMPIEDLMLQAYWALKPPIQTEGSEKGQVDYDKLASLQNQFLEKMPPEAREYIERELNRWNTPLVQEWDQARDLRAEQQKIPYYKYGTKSEQELVWFWRGVADEWERSATAANAQGDYDTYKYWKNKVRKLKAEHPVITLNIPLNPDYITFTYAPGVWELLQSWFPDIQMPALEEEEVILGRQ